MYSSNVTGIENIKLAD